MGANDLQVERSPGWVEGQAYWVQLILSSVTFIVPINLSGTGPSHRHVAEVTMSIAAVNSGWGLATFQSRSLAERRVPEGQGCIGANMVGRVRKVRRKWFFILSNDIVIHTTLHEHHSTLHEWEKKWFIGKICWSWKPRSATCDAASFVPWLRCLFKRCAIVLDNSKCIS